MDYIPVIDLASVTLDNNKSYVSNNSNSRGFTIPKEDISNWQSVADEIRKALSGIGFMYLKNHGISQELIENAFASSKSFFNLPQEVKSKYTKNPVVSSHGWVQPGQELLHPNSVYELRECFDIAGQYRFYPTPDEHPNFRDVMEKLENEGNKLMRILLKLVAISLELEDTDYFIKCCRHLERRDSSEEKGNIRNECDLRAIHYPVIPDNLQVPKGAVRCAEHTDYEILTLLFQDDIGGLEVKNVNRKWISAHPIPNTILVNTGDLLQFWTNGFYPATLHRVIIPDKEIQRRTARYSFAYFFAPDDETLVSPLKSKYIPVLVDEDGSIVDSDKPRITAYQHIMNRVKSAYQY